MEDCFYEICRHQTSIRALKISLCVQKSTHYTRIRLLLEKKAIELILRNFKIARKWHLESFQSEDVKKSSVIFYMYTQYPREYAIGYPDFLLWKLPLFYKDRTDIENVKHIQFLWDEEIEKYCGNTKKSSVIRFLNQTPEISVGYFTTCGF